MDPLQSFRNTLRPPRGNYLAQLWDSWPWAFEAVALILSALQLLGMIGVLAYFNGRVAETSAIITPNTIVSILSTGSKASLLSAAAGCISQSNWVLFADQPRRLFDFGIVADASRGPLGSTRLLFSKSFRGGLLVRLGALITLLTIALDPFAQQLVKLRNMQTSRPGGQISQATRYSLGKSINLSRNLHVGDNGRMSAELPLTVDADFAFKAAGMFGLAAESESIVQQTALNCPGEACEFSKVASLAVCSRCNDITSLLERAKVSAETLYSKITRDMRIPHNTIGLDSFLGTWTRYSLPNGLYLDNKDDDYQAALVYMTTLGTTNRTKALTMTDIDTLIWSQTIIKLVNDTSTTAHFRWPNYQVHASECALYYCAREFNFAFYNSTKKEVSSFEITGAKRHPASWIPRAFGLELGVAPDIVDSLAYHPNNSYISRNDLQLYIDDEDGSARSWNISKVAVTGISYFVQTLFSTCINTFQNCSDAPDEWPAPTGYYYCQIDRGEMLIEGYQPAPSKILWEAKDLNATFANIAKSMSNALRSSDDTKTSQIGTVIQTVTTYRIEWGWIALHCTVAVAMFSFFILTLLSRAPSGARVPVWKTSNLAILSRGPIVSDVLWDGQTAEQLEERAKLATVSLLQVGPTDLKPDMDVESQSLEHVGITTFQNSERTDKTWQRPTPHYERLE
ncbi:unnamed protein product [Clonostachys rosea]|uniref:Uncharacterized protein n=1 Tax=Bionectria ochroleuca TaxID=29856 RepID=A0ABY6UMP9_BIOOC|nr:unnamed protein product [Clonostachys rosea]